MRKSLRTAVIVLLSIGLLALFLRGAHLDVVWAEIRLANTGFIALATATTIMTMVWRALRWQYLLEPIGHARFIPAFRTTTIGFAASAVLPARAGEVIRPYLLARQEGLSATATFATIIIERLLDLTSVMMLFGVAILASGVDVGREVKLAGAIVGAIALAGLAVLALLAGHPERLASWTAAIVRILPAKLAALLEHFVRMFAEA